MEMMELREFLQLLGRYSRVLLLGAVLGGVLGLGVTWWLPEKENASLLLYVRRAAQASNPSFYTYDGYYSQQAAERYTDTVVGFLENPGILKQAAERLNLPTDQKFLKRLGRSVEIKRIAPQLINISVTRPSADEAQRLSLALATVTKARTEELNQVGDAALALDLVNAEPIVVRPEPILILDGVVGLLGGLLVSLLAALFWDYLRD